MIQSLRNLMPKRGIIRSPISIVQAMMQRLQKSSCSQIGVGIINGLDRHQMMNGRFLLGQRITLQS